MSSNILIRPETEADLEGIDSVVEAAFRRRDVVDLLHALRGSSAWRDLSFVAVQEQQVIGHVAYTRGWLDAPLRLVEALVLSPMSVHPDFQRQGVGTRLVTESVRTLDAPLVFLEGNPAFYSRAGFVGAGPLGFIRPSVRIPEPAFQVLRLRHTEPELTGQLVYPDAFWEYDSVGLRRG